MISQSASVSLVAGGLLLPRLETLFGRRILVKMRIKYNLSEGDAPRAILLTFAITLLTEKKT